MASNGVGKLGLPAGTSQRSPNPGWPWHRCSVVAGTQGATLKQTHVQAETGVGASRWPTLASLHLPDSAIGTAGSF